MILFLTGFYFFGGALSTFLALISGALLNSTARDNMLADPLGVIFHNSVGRRSPYGRSGGPSDRWGGDEVER